MSSTTRQTILDYIENNGSATGPELADHIGVTRQAINLHLRRLIADSKIVKTGQQRSTTGQGC